MTNESFLHKKHDTGRCMPIDLYEQTSAIKSRCSQNCGTPVINNTKSVIIRGKRNRTTVKISVLEIKVPLKLIEEEIPVLMGVVRQIHKNLEIQRSSNALRVLKIEKGQRFKKFRIFKSERIDRNLMNSDNSSKNSRIHLENLKSLKIPLEGATVEENCLIFETVAINFVRFAVFSKFDRSISNPSTFLNENLP